MIRMKRVILSSALGMVLFALLIAGAAAVRQYGANKELDRRITQLTSERDALQQRVQDTERQLAEVQNPPLSAEELAPAELGPTDEPDFLPGVALPADFAPQVTTNAHGKTIFSFAELLSPEGEVIAREAQFRELLGYSKLSFRTSEGVRYFDLERVHPAIVESLGIDPVLLKQRAAEELRLAQIRGVQAQVQQALRNKAAAEFAARQKEAAEQLRAENAAREAELRERQAQAAQQRATTQRIIRSKPILVLPYGAQIVHPGPGFENGNGGAHPNGSFSGKGGSKGGGAGGSVGGGGGITPPAERRQPSSSTLATTRSPGAASILR